MPTPLDKMLSSRNAVLGFAAAVGAASIWSIWGPDLFPAQSDPKGDPHNWEESEMRTWLKSRGLMPSEKATREELLERILANMKSPPKAS